MCVKYNVYGECCNFISGLFVESTYQLMIIYVKCTCGLYRGGGGGLFYFLQLSNIPQGLHFIYWENVSGALKYINNHIFVVKNPALPP